MNGFDGTPLKYESSNGTSTDQSRRLGSFYKDGIYSIHKNLAKDKESHRLGTY